MTYFKKTKSAEYGTEYVLFLFGVMLWASSHSSENGWVRILGRGISWKHEKRGLIFSERNGYVKYLKIGKWIIRYLPKNHEQQR